VSHNWINPYLFPRLPHRHRLVSGSVMQGHHRQKCRRQHGEPQQADWALTLGYVHAKQENPTMPDNMVKTEAFISTDA